MKVFLNDRVIEFIHTRPENPLVTDLVVEYNSVEKLKEDWADFLRYEKFRKFLIIDTKINEQDRSSAFDSFSSFFNLQVRSCIL